MVGHKANGRVRCCSHYRSGFWPCMINQQLHVLHNRYQVILNLHPPTTTPPRSFQSVSLPLSKRSFHKMLADLDISSCPSALCPHTHAIQNLLALMAFDGSSPTLRVSALEPQGTLLAYPAARHVLKRFALHPVLTPPKSLGSGLAIRQNGRSYGCWSTSIKAKPILRFDFERDLTADLRRLTQIIHFPFYFSHPQNVLKTRLFFSRIDVSLLEL